jgi:predicted ester cyclase
MHGVL